MQALHVTDFHGRETWFDWLVEASSKFDLTCLTGDMLDLLDLEHINSQIRLVRNRLSSISAPLAICSGNNDSFAEHPRLVQATWLQEIRRPNLWMDGDRFTAAGIRFRCLGWNAPTPSSGTGEVWLSHAPPARSPVSWHPLEGDDVGDEILLELCRSERGPEIILSGHQHKPGDWHCLVGRTHCFNPGSDLREPLPRYIVIDTTTRTAAYHRSSQEVVTVSLGTTRDFDLSDTGLWLQMSATLSAANGDINITSTRDFISRDR